MGSSATHENGRFDFAQTGHSHFALTNFQPELTPQL